MSGVVSSDTLTFEKEVLKSDIPAAVYFYSEDCPHCAAVAPIYERIAGVYNGKMKFTKVFRQLSRKLADKYNVKTSPTLLFIKGGQEVCSRLIGYVGKPEIRAAIESVLGEECIKKERQRASCDVLILGAGPAGLTAAIYAARAKIAAMVVDEGLAGGQVLSSFHIANYPGTNGVIRGLDLMENMKNQSLGFGAVIDDLKEVKEIDLNNSIKIIKTEDTDYYAKCVIIATGAQPRKLPAEGEREFRGRGIHYCAACDGAMYQDADVIVVGGGNSAVEEAVFLTRYAKHVTIIHRSDYFEASQTAQDELFKNSDISVIWNTQIMKVKGETFVKGATLQNLKTQELSEKSCDGIFVYIGSEPDTDIFKGKIKMNESGYIDTDENMRTSMAGVFAAGDVRNKTIRQITTAVSDGTIAGLMAERYVNRK